MQFSSEVFNKDISGYICNYHCDIPSLVSFAATTKSNRVFVSQEIVKQFNILLEYMQKASNTCDYPSIQKRIYAICLKVKSAMDTLEFKNSPELNTCINFKVFEQAFDLLKPFAHETHFNKEEVLNLNCPLLITEMLTPDNDEEICDTTNTNNDSKLISIIKEWKKLGLFEEGNPKDVTFVDVFGKKPVAFFNITKSDNKPELYVATFMNHSGRVANSLKFDLITCKWAVINDLYKKYFVDLKEGERAIPLSDFKAEVAKKYFEIYTYAAKQIKHVDEEKLENGEYCLGYTTTMDCSGRPYIFITFKVSDRLQKRRIPIESFSSTDEFDAFIQEQI